MSICPVPEELRAAQVCSPEELCPMYTGPSFQLALFLTAVTQGVDKSSLHVTHRLGHLVHGVEIEP